MNFTKYHLAKKYRKVLDNLSDEDKIKTILKRYKSFDSINDALTYYELKDHPLHKILALNKFNNPYDAYFYALLVIKGRWKEAEEFIKKDPYYACCYAKDVIKGRWKEAEDIIKTDVDVRWACDYAVKVIKGRWKEAEPYIIKNFSVAQMYAEAFNIKFKFEFVN